MSTMKVKALFLAVVVVSALVPVLLFSQIGASKGGGKATPKAHASTHKSGGSDEVATATAGANAIPKAGGGGALDAGWIPTHASTHQNGGSDQVATATAAANAIPKAGSGGTLAAGWSPNLVDTVDKGYFFAVSVYPTPSTATMAVFSANQVKVWQFVLPFSATVGQIAVDVVTQTGATECGGSNCHVQLGLYASDLTTVAVSTGVLTGGAGSINIQSNSVQRMSITAVTLSPGVYYVFMTTDSAVLALRGLSLASSPLNMLNVGSVDKAGACANAGSAGALPGGGCGAVTGGTAVPPMVLFER